MFKIKKLFVASLAIVASVFSASICAYAAQIDSLSIVDNTIYATTAAENARLYAVEYSEGLLSDVFFCDIGDDGQAELPLGKASEYDLFLWDKESLAPICSPYKLKENRAYAEGMDTPVPEYEFLDESAYSFNQDDDVMIVSEISEAEIKGFKAGVETTYALTSDVAVMGLSDSFADVVPGSVVLIGTNSFGNCAAIELLATLGIPVDEEAYRNDFGEYAPSDGSTKYKNIVDVMFSKGNTKITLRKLGGTSYLFESGSVMCYRVGLAMKGDTPIVTYTAKPVSEPKDTSVFKSTAEFSNYVYLRVDTEKSKTLDGTTYDGLITQCIVYCVPKELNFNPETDEDQYSPIFGLEPVVIID